MRHPGQGTANVCYSFGDKYLELLWQDDAAEIQSAMTTPTGLWERCNWRESGASRVGIAIRSSAGSTENEPPFPYWEYQPAYLPSGTSIPIATASKDVREPLIFFIPGQHQLSSSADNNSSKSETIQYQRLQGLGDNQALATLVELGLVQVDSAEPEKLMLSIPGLDNEIDLHPDMPLALLPT